MSKGSTRRPQVIPREVFEARWHQTFGMTFPCATCGGTGLVGIRAWGCEHHGNCPCGSDEIPCGDCIGGSVPCGMCGERPAVQEAREMGLMCHECAMEEEE